MGFMQGVSSLEHLPMDVTLKLSDGSIKINKIMLGIVSPVFKNMLYGSLKKHRQVKWIYLKITIRS